MISVFLFLAAFMAAPGSHRCGLSVLASELENGTAAGIQAMRADRTADTAGTRLFPTTHFAIWYKTGTAPDAIRSPWDALPKGDSVPAIIRTLGNALEKAWTYYVDTLGMRPPLASSKDGLIAGAPPAGLYPVEICRPERIYDASHWQDTLYYGLAQPVGNDGASRLFLTSRAFNSPTYSWSYPLDVGGTFSMDYSQGDNWPNALQATAVHELFHAVEFRYETSLTHFLFESSSIAMEAMVLPSIKDHMYYFAPLFGYGPDSKNPTVPMLQSSSTESYRHAIYMTGLMHDAGRDIMSKLWLDRASRGGSGRGTILATMRDNLSSRYSLRESMIRYGMRVLLSGRLRNHAARWDTIPDYSPWENAALAPSSSKLLTTPQVGSNTWSSLGAGELKFLSDPAIAGDLQVTWLPTNGAFLARIDSTASGFVRETLPAGITIIPASRRESSLWIVGSDGSSSSDSSAASYVSASATLSFRKSAPVVPEDDLVRASFSDATEANDSISRIFGSSTGDSIVLKGYQNTSHLSYIVQLLFKPADDSLGIDLARGGTSFSFSSSPTLFLRNAELSTPSTRWRYAYLRRNGTWTRLATRRSDGRTVVSIPSLTVGSECQFILSSQSVATEPFPNPSTGDAPVVFPLGGDRSGLKLSIFAADGSLVRQWGSSELSFNTVWDLRNQYGYRVRPGVYTWVLWGSRDERGRILVGR